MSSPDCAESAEPMPTRTAAAPTKLCRIATSSGIEVIATRAASVWPMSAPTSSAPKSAPSTSGEGGASDTLASE